MQGAINLTVDHLELLGADTLVHGHFKGEEKGLTISLSDIKRFEKHTILPLNVSPEKVHLFDMEHGKRIGG